MENINAMVAKQADENDTIFLNQLNNESSGPIIVMICRRWDVISVRNKYLSTDFIISDEKGNVLHCFVKASIAYRFKPLLEDGSLYLLKDFSVLPNPPKYRILKDAEFMIELHGSTIVTKQTADVDKFIRHPFHLVAFEKIMPTENKYFVDVIGYVTILGPASKKATGSQTVEFNLTNERGFQLRVTLWGGLGDNMIQKKRMHPGVYIILLTCMSSKEYLGNLCLSSSSSTMLIDDATIPAIQAFKEALRGVDIVDTGVPLLQVKPKISTLRELIEWGRTKSKKEAAAYQGSVQITNVRTRKSWFNYTCTSAKCRKGVEPNPSNVFWCDSCNTEVKYPRPRYRLQLDITDGTTDSVVMLFDEVAEKLVGRPVRSLITEAEKDDTGSGFVLPTVLHDLIGSSHVFEIRTHTYFQAGEYESFNCSQIIQSGPDVEDHHNNIPSKSKATVDVRASSSNIGLNTECPNILQEKFNISKSGHDTDETELKISDDITDNEMSRTHGRKRRMVMSDSEDEVEDDPKGKKQA